MKVTITFNSLPTVTMSIDQWVEIGKIRGYCKANKIRVTEINQIEYTP